MTESVRHRTRRPRSRRGDLRSRRGGWRPGGYRRGSRRRAQWAKRNAARALSLSRRAGVRRHGAGAGRHVQRPGDRRARPLCGPDSGDGEDGPCGDAARSRPALRYGDVAQVVALGRVRFHLAAEAPADRLCRGLRSRRLQARLQRHGGRGQDQRSTAQLVQPRHRRGWRDQGRDLREQGGPAGHPRQDRRRCHRRPRCRRLGRRAVHRGRLYRDHGVSPRRRRISRKPSASSTRSPRPSRRSIARPSASSAARGTNGG